MHTIYERKNGKYDKPMKDKILDILSYVLLVLGVLWFIWLTLSKFELEHSRYENSTGFAIYVLVYLPLLIVTIRSIKRIRRKKARHQDELMKYGKAFMVDLNACKIHSDKGYGSEDHRIVTCVVETKIYYKGEDRSFVSDNIRMDEESLGILLAEKREAKLYINPSNPDDYFFDLRFLGNSIC